jgi:hypothetical protein
MTAQYDAGSRKMVLHFSDGMQGYSFVLPAVWTAAAMERSVSELEDLYG